MYILDFALPHFSQRIKLYPLFPAGNNAQCSIVFDTGEIMSFGVSPVNYMYSDSEGVVRLGQDIKSVIGCAVS